MFRFALKLPVLLVQVEDIATKYLSFSHNTKTMLLELTLHPFVFKPIPVVPSHIALT